MEEPGACTFPPPIGDSCNNLFSHLFCRRGFLVAFGVGFFFSFWLAGFGFLGGEFGLTWAGDTVKHGPPQEKAWPALRVPPEVTRETGGSGATSASQPDAGGGAGKGRNHTLCSCGTKYTGLLTVIAPSSTYPVTNSPLPFCSTRKSKSPASAEATRRLLRGKSLSLALLSPTQQDHSWICWLWARRANAPPNPVTENQPSTPLPARGKARKRSGSCKNTNPSFSSQQRLKHPASPQLEEKLPPPRFLGYFLNVPNSLNTSVACLFSGEIINCSESQMDNGVADWRHTGMQRSDVCKLFHWICPHLRYFSSFS